VLTRTKVFQEEQYYERPAGAAPEDWRVRHRTLPVDEQINAWVDETGHRPVFASAPGLDTRWVNKDQTVKCLTIAVVILYEPKEAPVEPDPEPAEYTGG
jgi:hypothetical protein